MTDRHYTLRQNKAPAYPGLKMLLVGLFLVLSAHMGSAQTTVQDGGVFEVRGVDVDVTAVLGTATMPISQILKLGRGAVVELERFIGEEIDLRAENKLIAKGEIVVTEDRLGVSITEIIKRR